MQDAFILRNGWHPGSQVAAHFHVKLHFSSSRKAAVECLEPYKPMLAHCGGGGVVKTSELVRKLGQFIKIGSTYLTLQVEFSGIVDSWSDETEQFVRRLRIDIRSDGGKRLPNFANRHCLCIKKTPSLKEQSGDFVHGDVKIIVASAKFSA